MRYLLASLAMIWASPAIAQINNPGASQADLSALQSQIPSPAATVATPETVGGAAGSAMTFRRGDAIPPRITRAANCTLDSNGTCSVTWATSLSAPPTIVTTPVNPSAAQPIMCNTTVTPSATAVSIKCWVIQSTTLSLAIITAGLNLVPATTASAGTVVQIIALPPTQ